MMTGIGVTAVVSEIEWVAPNNNYPAEPKFIGELTTSTGETHVFVSDRKLKSGAQSFKIEGRLVTVNDTNRIEVADASPV